MHLVPSYIYDHCKAQIKCLGIRAIIEQVGCLPGTKPGVSTKHWQNMQTRCPALILPQTFPFLLHTFSLDRWRGDHVSTKVMQLFEPCSGVMATLSKTPQLFVRSKNPYVWPFLSQCLELPECANSSFQSDRNRASSGKLLLNKVLSGWVES